MYFRYFMWNFAGRQNDIQASFKTEINKGNWISGIPFIDNMQALEIRARLPDTMKNNKARNRYFMLPLLLGLVGLVYQYRKTPEGFPGDRMVLFIMTGLAIVVYLNQSPLAAPRTGLCLCRFILCLCHLDRTWRACIV